MVFTADMAHELCHHLLTDRHHGVDGYTSCSHTHSANHQATAPATDGETSKVVDLECLFAELAEDGTRRRRLSGRVRSGKLQHHTDQYSGPPLYTVVTMDPNDEVLTSSHALISFTCFGVG